MKRLLIFLIALLGISSALGAQTAEEILEKMDAQMGRSDAEGIAMTMDMKIPILGTFTSTMYELKDKSLVETKIKGENLLVWTDATTEWTYNSKKNELTIEDAKPGENSAENENLAMLDGISDGYDISIQKETADAWHILCKKSKTNKEKDDPKKMEIVIAKSNYMPVSISTSMSGVKVTMRDFRIGVSDAQVTFDPARYPTATVVDKRGQEAGKK